jgi:hypothetical protein
LVSARPILQRLTTTARFVVALSAAASATACEVAGTVAPEVERRVVVHAVLNPTSALQSVIVEETLRSIGPNPGGPVQYEPISNARVVIYGSREDSVVMSGESSTTLPGVYRVQSVTITNGSPGTAPPNVLRLRPGERYRLRVETPLGVVTGQTIIPVSGGPVDGSRRIFNLDHDTLRLDVSRVQNAAGFLLRHESRSNALERFVTTLDATLVHPLASAAADDDWPFSFAHDLVMPGLAQNFIVVAVDSNYFRYHEAGFDPFGDETRGNTLTGGVGLFGSVATVMAKTLDLTADIDTPIEGAWTADRASLTLPFNMTLYASPGFPGDQPQDFRVSLSGSGRLSGGRRLEITASGTTGIRLFNIVDANDGFSTLANGQLTGANLVLTDPESGERVTYRRP